MFGIDQGVPSSGPVAEFMANFERIQNEIQTNQIDGSVKVNGRRLTNLGIFRAYIERYLRAHPLINKDMTLLVRQLQPTDTGVPIEIYVFCTDVRWVHYEAVQADIFDHIFAVLPEFGLHVFQSPSGADFKKTVGW